MKLKHMANVSTYNFVQLFPNIAAATSLQDCVQNIFENFQENYEQNENVMSLRLERARYVEILKASVSKKDNFFSIKNFLFFQNLSEDPFVELKFVRKKVAEWRKTHKALYFEWLTFKLSFRKMHSIQICN